MLYSKALAQSGISWNRLLRAASSQVLKISKDGDYKISLGNLCEYLITHTANTVFPCVETEFPAFQFVLSWPFTGLH